ncbi:hypothetical protein SPOG_05195 [Schizosaccharomyces cryophilus OY26]|uniref:Uncharacterized protein n=1 Tax=Schizosaccharomyces cryophilus (strain OY26 / ATCC MYA-4695 / CBS 11777 / NBRC 106824 / NRRL Y48691) TaxID=653667 RepID=S9VVZ3_SCHCR|nr:uncharacterized protein SPOG_05195 [Schizosaccharomyces cryophilus OY26]EPY50369.1 hypothetical protein SPOG_05195 [Schizosaccharomyces cryophilus OY26]
MVLINIRVMMNERQTIKNEKQMSIIQHHKKNRFFEESSMKHFIFMIFFIAIDVTVRFFFFLRNRVFLFIFFVIPITSNLQNEFAEAGSNSTIRLFFHQNKHKI